MATPTTSSSLADLSKMYPGLDPKLLASAGMDPKLLAGMDPKLLAGMEPKLLAGLDAKTLAAYGIDPKFVQEANKSSEKSSSSASAAKPPSMLLDPKMLGLDPKMLAGLDPKVLIEMGIDPKLVDPKASSAA